MSGSFDTSEFISGLRRAEDVLREAFGVGLGQAGAMLLRDSTMEAPTVPKKFGNLRGSGSVLVNGRLVTTGAQVFGESGTPATEETPPADRNEIVCAVGFNTVYAAPMHEGRWETGPLAGVEVKVYKEPGSGKFFLSKKIAEHGPEYLEEATRIAKGRAGF